MSFGDFAFEVARNAKRPSLSVPVCRYHRWIVPPSTLIVSDNGDTFTLANVAAEFIAELPREVE